jgi:indoleamine 2,3-dioxygenase
VTDAYQIPLSDNLLQISMPDTPLTDILRDFRAYRPGNHREFLEWVHNRANQVQVKSFALEDPTSAAIYLQALNQVRDFRWRHWCFTREYILKQTKHKTATGGSPIVTVSGTLIGSTQGSAKADSFQWLPNQLQAVLDQMVQTRKFCRSEHVVEDIMDLVELQRQSLQKEVEKYSRERGF